jgi:hypothetical protein
VGCVMFSYNPNTFCSKHNVWFDDFKDLECPKCTEEAKPERERQQRQREAERQQQEAARQQAVDQLNQLLSERQRS